jgi:hypothetical protein
VDGVVTHHSNDTTVVAIIIVDVLIQLTTLHTLLLDHLSKIKIILFNPDLNSIRTITHFQINAEVVSVVATHREEVVVVAFIVVIMVDLEAVDAIIILIMIQNIPT